MSAFSQNYPAKKKLKLLDQVCPYHSNQTLQPPNRRILRKLDRVTMLSQNVKERLKQHLQKVKRIREADLKKGYDIRTIQELLGHSPREIKVIRL